MSSSLCLTIPINAYHFSRLAHYPYPPTAFHHRKHSQVYSRKLALHHSARLAALPPTLSSHMTFPSTPHDVFYSSSPNPQNFYTYLHSATLKPSAIYLSHPASLLMTLLPRPRLPPALSHGFFFVFALSRLASRRIPRAYLPNHHVNFYVVSRLSRFSPASTNPACFLLFSDQTFIVLSHQLFPRLSLSIALTFIRSISATHLMLKRLPGITLYP